MVEISDKQIMLLSSDSNVLCSQLSAVLACMRGELDDHRLAINENTDEIASTHEFLNELNKKLDKLVERVDNLTLLVKGDKDEKSFSFQSLSDKEKDVFMALYELTETQPFTSYNQIARKTMLPKSMVISHTTAMIRKGIPVLKKYQGNTVYLKLVPEFRETQAKKNVVGINSRLTCWL